MYVLLVKFISFQLGRLGRRIIFFVEKFLLNKYYMPGRILSTEDRPGNNESKILAFVEFTN